MVISLEEVNQITYKQIKLLEDIRALNGYYQNNFHKDNFEVSQHLNSNHSENWIAKDYANNPQKFNMEQYNNNTKESKELIQAYSRYYFVQELIRLRIQNHPEEFDEKKAEVDEALRQIDFNLYAESGDCCNVCDNVLNQCLIF